jgi:hypothetical protein
MESTEDDVAAIYSQQRNLEEDDQEKLLEKEPGEVDDPTPPKPDILDVSMEDQEERSVVPPPPPPPPPPSGTEVQRREKSREVSGSQSLSITNPNTDVVPSRGTANPNEGDGANTTNPTRGVVQVGVNMDTTNPIRGVGPVTHSNKTARYLAARDNSTTVTTPYQT